MQNITATQVNYYHICHRKLWLSANGIEMEHTSDLVAEGKLIGDSSYPQRAERYTEVAFDGVKIDFYDAKNRVVHEIKKSDRMEGAHVAQVKYYLWILEQNGITGAKGILEYPKLRHTEGVVSPVSALPITPWFPVPNPSLKSGFSYRRSKRGTWKKYP